MRDFFERTIYDGKRDGAIRTQFSDGSVMEIGIEDGMAQSFLYDRNGVLMDNDIKRMSPYGRWMLTGQADEGETDRNFYTLLVEGEEDDPSTTGFDVMREFKGELVSIPLTDSEILEAYGEVVRKEIGRQVDNIFLVAEENRSDAGIRDDIVERACGYWWDERTCSEADALSMAIDDYAEGGDVVPDEHNTADDARLIEEKAAFKMVLDALSECPLFTGTYDAANGSRSFMHGISTVMEAIAERAGDDDFMDRFDENIAKSQKGT